MTVVMDQTVSGSASFGPSQAPGDHPGIGVLRRIYILRNVNTCTMQVCMVHKCKKNHKGSVDLDEVRTFSDPKRDMDLCTCGKTYETVKYTNVGVYMKKNRILNMLIKELEQLSDRDVMRLKQVQINWCYSKVDVE